MKNTYTGIVTEAYRVENKIPARVRFRRGDQVTWKTWRGDWFYGTVAKVKRYTIIVDRTAPAGAFGLELRKVDVL